jgi:hypothetical protein
MVMVAELLPLPLHAPEAAMVTGFPEAPPVAATGKLVPKTAVAGAGVVTAMVWLAGVGVAVGVDVDVGVAVGVLVGVAVCVGVAVLVGVDVGVFVGVDVADEMVPDAEAESDPPLPEQAFTDAAVTVTVYRPTVLPAVKVALTAPFESVLLSLGVSVPALVGLKDQLTEIWPMGWLLQSVTTAFSAVLAPGLSGSGVGPVRVRTPRTLSVNEALAWWPLLAPVADRL